MSETQKAQILEDLLNKVHPKARYMSQMHIEDNTDSVVKQIINGDIQIPYERGEIDNLDNRKDFETQIKQKFLSKVQRQKKILEQKLSYISNSISSLKKYQQLKNGSQYSPNHRDKSYQDTISEQIKQRDHTWRNEIAIRSKQLQQKKNKIEEQTKQKQQQMKQVQERIKMQEQNKRKQQILQNMHKIKSRMEKRDCQVKNGNQKLKEILHRKKLHEKLEQNYHQNLNSQLEERKKKLAVIRSMHKPLDSTEILQHQQKFIQIKKQKQQLRQREKRMNQSRSKSYKAPYESVYYKRLLEVNQDDGQTSDKIKMEKMKQFSEHVKQHFAPAIDEGKKKYFQQIKEKQQEMERKKEQRQKQLFEKSKIKGLQYLEMIKKMPKKRKQTSPNTDRSHQTQKTKYPNYLNRSVNIGKKSWTTILNSSLNKQQKAFKMHFESQRVQEQLHRKQVQTRLLKQKDTGEIDQRYYQMIKAKLDLLQDS